MIYSLSLETALLLVGLFLVASHTVAYLLPEQSKAWLKSFPRSGFAGMVLLSIAAVWFYWLISTMDLGEFDKFRKLLKIGTPIAAVLTGMYVQEFLAVRALGMVTLLGSEVLLEAAWMRPEASRLWMVSLVYVWITAALFWVGMPYTLRDQIAWVTASRSRWNAATITGIVFGVILLIARFGLTPRH
jgi:hypothetical protein